VSDLPAYEFGPFRLDPTERLLLRDGQAVALTPKAFDLLVYLVERHGHLVERQVLMAALWPEAVVEEANLAYNVSAVRKALGDGQEGDQFIQTVPTRGYRFVAPVHALSRGAEARRALTPGALIGIVAVALAVGALIGGVAVRRLGRSEPPVRPVRFEIPVTMGAGPAFRQLSRPAISRDGTRLAYVVGGPDGPQLHVRDLASPEAVRLSGTDGAGQPFFSPDGQSIGFFARNQLLRVDLATGHVTRLCPASGASRGATWGMDDRIYFSAPYSGISVVPASGGQPKALTEVGPDEVAEGYPELLPGERHLMFSRWDTEVVDDAKIEVLSLDGRERRTLFEGGYAAKYVPGHLVYVRRGALVAVPFDASGLRLTGTPSEVMEGIAFVATTGQAFFDVSLSGMLAYFPGAALDHVPTSMVWIEPTDRKRQAVEAPSGFYIDPVLSPDGRRLALAPNYGSHQDIWVGDLTRGTWTRLTVNPRNDNAPVWRPDDPAAILFSMGRGGTHPADLFSVPADASHPPELIYESAYPKFASSSSAAAGLVAFTEFRPDTKTDIWLLQLGAKPVARPFLKTPFWESTPTFSPDGAWLAYESDESGRSEIYARAISGSSGKWQISNGGGDRPRWSRDGRQIVYRCGKRMMAAKVAIGAALTVDRPGVLFEGAFEEGGLVTPNYDIAPDGRFLMIEPSPDQAPAATHLVVIDNWFTELRQKLAP
jgi:DNA-binding winged helix-turn-helix (wHTH) protein/Tol biopolymer transport system component